ncbi:hypothetical protein [Glaciihabitans sp. dw_435]|uniref:hypothetical protein n=1 Tax=Glaciihabitans sp. dw_435 TaxID=2720081 RepID=UPI001BD690C7|nr:hypothetical protein [Glaciihabitans sp. dw_435]
MSAFGTVRGENGSPLRVHSRVVAVVRRDDDLLVTGGHDNSINEDYFRPIGGEVATGENAELSLRRVIRSLLGSEISDIDLLGEIESTQTSFTEAVREVTFVYECTLDREQLYSTTEIALKNTDRGATASWQPIALFAQDEALLYPDGMLELLEDE